MQPSYWDIVEFDPWITFISATYGITSFSPLQFYRVTVFTQDFQNIRYTYSLTSSRYSCWWFYFYRFYGYFAYNNFICLCILIFVSYPIYSRQHKPCSRTIMDEDKVKSYDPSEALRSRPPLLSQFYNIRAGRGSVDVRCQSIFILDGLPSCTTMRTLSSKIRNCYTTPVEYVSFTQVHFLNILLVQIVRLVVHVEVYLLQYPNTNLNYLIPNLQY